MPEQASRRPRLPAEFGDPRRDVCVQVRIRVEHPGDPRQVLGAARDVGPDEGRRRVFAEGFEGVDDPIERGNVARSPTYQSGFASSSSIRSFVPSSGWKKRPGRRRGS